MSQPNDLLSTTDLLLRCWQEIQNRFKSFFLLALIGPFAAWVLRTIFLSDKLALLDLKPDDVLLVSIVSVVIMIIALWAMVALVLFVCKRVYSWGDLFRQSLIRLPRVIAGLFFYVIFFSLYVTIFIVGIYFLLHQQQVMLFQLLALILELFLLCSVIYISVASIMLPYILVLTDIPLWMTIPSAFNLLRHHWWKTFALLIVLCFIALIISCVFSVALWLLSIPFALTLQGSSYIFSFLGIIPVALSLLTFHIPLIGFYVNLSYWWQIRSYQNTSD